MIWHARRGEKDKYIAMEGKEGEVKPLLFLSLFLSFLSLFPLSLSLSVCFLFFSLSSPLLLSLTHSSLHSLSLLPSVSYTTQEDAWAMFGIIDADRNGRISLDEFVAYYVANF